MGLQKISMLSFLLFSGAVAGDPAVAADAPFIQAAGIVRKIDEQSSLSPAQLAYLTEIRLRPFVVRATIAVCDARAFLSTSVSVHLPHRRSLTLSRTRQEINLPVEPREGGTRFPGMTLWVGRTNHGGDVMFSISENGSASGLLDDEGDKFEFQTIDSKRCLVIEDDPRKFPRDD